MVVEWFEDFWFKDCGGEFKVSLRRELKVVVNGSVF